MRTRQLLIGLFATTLLVGACANGQSETPSPSGAAPASSAPATAATSVAPTGASTAPATASAGATATASATAAASGATSAPATAPATAGPQGSFVTCTPDAPTSLSASWSTLQAHDGDYTFKFPGTWDKLYGAFVFNTSSLVDATTFAETGLPAASETRADLVRAPGVGLPNASVLIVPGVVSDTPTIFARQVDRFKAITDIKVISSTLTACIGGQQALGISFTFNNGTTYQESWYMVRAGRSYDFQWLAAAPAVDTDTATFREMFRTWTWSPNIPVATPQPFTSAAPSVAPSSSAATSSFILAGMATKVDTAATSANTKDFLTTIPKASTAIYAVFSLQAGLTGQVNGALMQADKTLVTLSLQYGTKNTWGDFRINSANGVAPGDYTMVLTFVPSGESINLPFTVK